MLSRPFDSDLVRAGLSPRIGQLNPQVLGKIASGQRRGILDYLLIVSRSDDVAAALARAGTEIEDAIGSLHNVRIMFHDENRVPQIAQVMKDLDQPVRIAAVQANGWLIEHVQRSHQARPQRSCELDSLRLTARQS